MVRALAELDRFLCHGGRIGEKMTRADVKRWKDRKMTRGPCHTSHLRPLRNRNVASLAPRRQGDPDLAAKLPGWGLPTRLHEMLGQAKALRCL